MPPNTRKPEQTADERLFRRRFVLPDYAAATDCSPAVITEAVQAGHRPTSDPFIESTDDLAGDRKVIVWAVAV